MTAFEFAFARSIFNAAGSAVLVKCVYNQTFFSSIPTELRSVTALRCICGTFTFLLLTSAVKFIPLGIFFVIVNAAVFSTALLAYFCLFEQMTSVEMTCMCFAFSGIMMLGYAKDSADSSEF